MYAREIKNTEEINYYAQRNNVLGGDWQTQTNLEKQSRNQLLLFS